MTRIFSVTKHETNSTTSNALCCTREQDVTEGVRFRNTRYTRYLQNIDHSLEFVNEALTHGWLDRSIVEDVCRSPLRLEISPSPIESVDEQTT
jgi:hypothetical protein